MHRKKFFPRQGILGEIASTKNYLQYATPTNTFQRSGNLLKNQNSCCKEITSLIYGRKWRMGFWSLRQEVLWNFIVILFSMKAILGENYLVRNHYYVWRIWFVQYSKGCKPKVSFYFKVWNVKTPLARKNVPSETLLGIRNVVLETFLELIYKVLTFFSNAASLADAAWN